MNKSAEKHVKYVDGKPVPKYVQCYKFKKDAPVDPYTIVFTRASSWGGKEYRGRKMYVSANGCPFHPACGIYQHGEAEGGNYGFGSRIKFTDMPRDLKQAVLNDYSDLWDIQFGIPLFDAMVGEGAE